MCEWLSMFVAHEAGILARQQHPAAGALRFRTKSAETGQSVGDADADSVQPASRFRYVR